MIRENYKRKQKNGILYIIMGLSFAFIGAACMLLMALTSINSNSFSLISKLFLLIGLLIAVYGYKMMTLLRIKTEADKKREMVDKDLDIELQKLDKLREDGIISEKELMLKRKKIMDTRWG